MAGQTPEVFSAASTGDLDALARDLDADWALAGRMLRWLASRDAHHPAVALPDTLTPGRGSAWALWLRARVAFLTLDLETLARCGARLEAMDDPHARLFARLVRGQRRCMAGDPSSVFAMAATLQDEARALSEPTLVVESVLLSALAAASAEDHEEALKRARLAARMAQSERLWLTHFTTSVLLARARRMTGQPHLAGMIARGCLEVAPALFGGWLRWELLHAGVEPPPPRVDNNAGNHAERAASLAAAWLCRGERDVLDPLDASVEGSALHAQDRRVVVAATSSEGALETLEGDARRWFEGETTELPPALSGLIAPTWRDPSAPQAPLALGRPGAGAGRRVLGIHGAPGHALLAPVGAKAARPEAVAAALTLSGARGVDRPTLFASAYGFAFRPELHEPSFKVVRHQAKKLLEGHAEITRDGEQVYLEVKRPYAVVDPRVREPLSHIVLRALASGADSAKSVARRLGVPLRTVQMQLKHMVDDGACVARKEGRHVIYAVEDTTYCELTQA